MLPLSATVASSAVFDAFAGASKLEALLHGHSYAGNAIGCALACKALDLFSSPATNPNLMPASNPTRWGTTGNLLALWDEHLVVQLSHNPKVTRVVALGEDVPLCSQMTSCMQALLAMFCS